MLALLAIDLTMGFAEAYMRGQIEVKGDLADVVSAAIRALQPAGWSLPSGRNRPNDGAGRSGTRRMLLPVRGRQ